jgi:hypothetical protein
MQGKDRAKETFFTCKGERKARMMKPTLNDTAQCINRFPYYPRSIQVENVDLNILS